MENFLKNNWFKISILVIIVAVMGVSFYWSQWRPTQIRKNCYLDSLIVGGKATSGLPSLVGTSDNNLYTKCLKSNGL